MNMQTQTTGFESAVRDDAARWKAKLEAKIHAGAQSAIGLLERVQNDVPTDLVAKASAMTFSGADGFSMVLPKAGALKIHKHARSQIAARAGVPGAFLEELSTGSDWQRACAADLLERHFINGLGDQRHLVRHVRGEVRGFLSNRFRRLDNRPLLDTFVAAMDKAGAVAIDGTYSDVRVALKAVIPRVYMPLGSHEAVAYGIEWGNSDFGSAKHSIRVFLLRLWCLNGATMEDALAQVHLGRSLSEDIEFSDRTMQLDTAASQSAMKDIVRGLLDARKIDATMAGIKAAGEKGMTLAQLKSKVQKRLFAGELKAVEEAWNTEDVAVLPTGDTAWRASNALSWVAKGIKDADRKLEVERLAGVILNGKDD